jgi:hypothetical protein
MDLDPLKEIETNSPSMSLSLGFLLGLAFIGVGLARYRLQQKIGSDE